MSKGYVYVLSNPSMPGLVKIGWSGVGAMHRAKSLSNTSVPSAFVVEFEILCLDPEKAEERAHRAAHHKRVDARREFFKLPINEAVCYVIDAARVDWARFDEPQPAYWERVVEREMTDEEREQVRQRRRAYFDELKSLLDQVEPAPWPGRRSGGNAR
jgi:hypothetical protein